MSIILQLFNLLKEIELQAAELYRTIALNWRLKREKVADFFETIAAEEELHAQQIQLLFNIALENPDAFKIEQFTIPTLQNTLQWIKEKRNEYFQQSEKAELEEVFKTAIALESNLAERHHTLFLKIDNQQIKNLFASLSQQDNNHLQKLRQFLIGFRF